MTSRNEKEMKQTREQPLQTHRLNAQSAGFLHHAALICTFIELSQLRHLNLIITHAFNLFLLSDLDSLALWIVAKSEG